MHKIHKDVLHSMSIDKKSKYGIEQFLQKNAFNPYMPENNFENFVNVSSSLIKLLPEEVIQALLTFRRYGNDQGVVIIRNLPLNERKIGATPKHWKQSDQTKESFETEMCLLGITSLLGDVFSFHTQHEGNLIQNIVPMPNDRYEQVGTGSEVFLDWHTEDAFHEMCADFIALLCLRSDSTAATTFASIRQMNIPDRYKHKLFEKRYLAGIDKAHGGTGCPEDGVLTSIFYGNYHYPSLRVDTSCIKGLDPEAQEAVDVLIQEMNRVSCQFILQQGDLLIMDNHTVVHGRTAFIPRFDGTDRWLQRVSIQTDFRKINAARTIEPRVVKMII